MPASPFAHRVPLVPVLSGRAFGRSAGTAGAALPSLLDLAERRIVSSGRIAIAMALRAMAVGPADQVLVPAYHSRSMIPPLLWRGATPVFFRLHADTTADLDDIAAKIGPATRAVMVTHYFGFPQDLRALRALCDRHGLQLLEDCAHCLFGEHDGQPVGSTGDYAIGSIMKFLPVYEGGCLVSARHSLAPVRLHGGGAGFEAKAMLAVLEASFASARLRWLGALLRIPLAVKDRLWRARKQRGAAPALAPASSDSSYEFDARWIDVRSAWFSRLLTGLLMRPLPRQRNIARRRQHYQRYAHAVANLPGCRALYPALPGGACPWLFALLVDDADVLAARLGAAGVPLVRFADTLWDGVGPHTCANSAMLSRQVLAFPCHAELDDAELAWIVAQLTGQLARCGSAP